MTASTFQWKRVASLWVPGQPVAQPRPRARAMMVKNKPIAQIYNPKTADGWKTLIACHAAGRGPAAPLDCPIRVDCTFYFPRPQYLLKAKAPDGPVPFTVKPDKDNLEKAVLDVLTDADWWSDDSRVFTGMVTKLYVAKSRDPGAFIEVSVLDDEQGDLFEGNDH